MLNSLFKALASKSKMESSATRALGSFRLRSKRSSLLALNANNYIAINVVMMNEACIRQVAQVGQVGYQDLVLMLEACTQREAQVVLRICRVQPQPVN